MCTEQVYLDLKDEIIRSVSENSFTNEKETFYLLIPL